MAERAGHTAPIPIDLLGRGGVRGVGLWESSSEHLVKIIVIDLFKRLPTLVDERDDATVK